MGPTPCCFRLASSLTLIPKIMRNVIRFKGKLLSIFNAKLPNCWLPRAKERDKEDVPSTRFCPGYTSGLRFFDAGPTLTKLKKKMKVCYRDYFSHILILFFS